MKWAEINELMVAYCWQMATGALFWVCEFTGQQGGTAGKWTYSYFNSILIKVNDEIKADLNLCV